MKLPRFRVRTLMIAVAVVGLTLGGLAGLVRMEQRRQSFRALARNHQRQEIVNRLTLVGLVAHRAPKADTERHRTLAEYHRALNQKYTRAASYPWLQVAPDPPEPK